MKDTETSKEKLEIEKLKLEISYAKRNFIVQAVSSAGILLLGMVVFMSFQLPQINIMAESRDANERAEIAKILISIRNN